MKDILDEIIANKQKELIAQKEAVSLKHLENKLPENAPVLSMREALEKSSSGIIAEFKRRSPSKGWIKEKAKIADIVPTYLKNGATALSILTDNTFFGGNLKDLKEARQLVNIPLLRKDFIIDEYQVYQAKIMGANAILLIAAALTTPQCEKLARLAHALKLEVLLEIHREEELEYINECIDMIGVNNRNLGTFHTDIENSFKLASLLPENILLVSESGISVPDTITKLRAVGFCGFLIGETFMRTNDPGKALGTFIREIDSNN